MEPLKKELRERLKGEEMVFDWVNREANLTCNYLATPVYPDKGFAIKKKQDREIILVAFNKGF